MVAVDSCSSDVKSRNESIAMTALSVIRDLQNWQSQLMQYDRQLPSRVLSILLGALHYHKDRLDKSEEVVSCGNHANQDTFSFNSSQFSAPTINSYISDIKGPKNNPVAGSTITTIVEWVITIPEEAKIDSFNTIIREVFKVLENISLDKPIFEKIGSCSIMAIDESLSKKYNVKEMSEEEHGQETMEEMCCSYQKIPDSEPISDLDYIKKLQTKIRRHAETALFFLSQYYQQFPLCGGPDYSNSMVFEYNPGKADSYHEKEVKLFNESEDLQMLIIDGRIITTSLELPIMDKDELPYNSSPGYGRTIVRNIVGRFCWSSKKVHSLHQSEHSKKMHSLNEQDKLPKLSKLTPLDFTDDIEIDSSTLVLKPVSASGPPRWFRRDCNDCNDLLHQSIEYVRDCSEEISFCKRRKKTEEAYEKKKIDNLLQQQIENEKNSRAKTYCTDIPLRVFPAPQAPFQHCREFISQLGMLSWGRRNLESGSKVQLFDKKSVMKELPDLDERYNRESLKVGLVYIAKGQETRKKILENNEASADFERFAGGLGWEMKWSELQGYKPFFGSTQSSGSTIHYATPFLEILFHVATRMRASTDDESLYKFKYIGNDYVCVIWSEHDRDYDSSILKSHYLDAMIIIYPIPKLSKYRVQIKTKYKSIQFGPLFDGAIVGQRMLPSLVRATVRNACRALARAQNRAPYYDERATKIKKITELQRSSTFEELAMETMSPGLFDSSKYAGWNEVTLETLESSVKTSGTAYRSKKKNQSERVSQGYNTTDANISDSSRVFSATGRTKKLKSECSDSDQAGKKSSIH